MGLKLTTILAEIVMLMFDLKFKSKLNEEGLQPKLYKRYVDDSNLAGEEIKEGFGVVRKDDGSVKLDRIEGELDREESATKRTARIIGNWQTPLCQHLYKWRKILVKTINLADSLCLIQRFGLKMVDVSDTVSTESQWPL